MFKAKPKSDKANLLKRVVLAILPGLVVFGLVLSANYYYDLDTSTVKLQEKKEISVSSSGSVLTVTQSGAGYAAIFTGGYVGIGTTTPATTLGVYGTSTFMGGNVGIGTTTPSYKLSIDGGAGSASGLTIENLGTATYGIDLSRSGLSTAGDFYIYNTSNHYWSADGRIVVAGINAANYSYVGQSNGLGSLSSSGIRNLATSYMFSVGDGGGGIIADYAGSYILISPSFTEFNSYANNHSLIAGIGIRPINITPGVATVSDTATIYIEDAATTTVVTGGNYALWVDNGISRFDGDVGIGTTSPSSLFEIYSSTDNTKLTITSATATDPQIVFRTASTTATRFVLGVDYSDSNKFKIATSTIGTTDVLTIDQNGYVGIGTTSPSYKLDVSGGSGIVAQFSGRVIGANAVNNNEFTTLAQLSGGGGPWSRTGSYVYLTTSTDSVGIGTSTPAYALDVYGTSRLGSSTSTQVILRGYVQSDIIPYSDLTYNLGSSNFRWGNIYAATGTFGGTITVNSTDITGSGALNLTGAAGSIWKTSSGALTIQSADILTATSTGAMIFGTAGAERMRILDTGNIGIGTTSPSSLFEIYSSTDNTKLTITSATATDPQIVFRTASTTATRFVLGVDYSDSNKFKIATSTIGTTDVLTIDQNGYVGIGTSSPQVLLHIGTASSTQITSPSRSVMISGELEVAESAYFGPMEFPADSGAVSWIDMAVSSTTASNTIESYTASLGGTNILTIYGQAVGAGGGIKNPRIGIGITTPTSTLEIYSATDNTKLTITSATATDPQIVFRTSTTTVTRFVMGVDFSDSNKFKIATSTIGTTDVLTIDQNGNVGIGTTTPAAKLDIWGTGTTDNGLYVNIATTSSSYYGLDVVSGGTSRLYVRADGNVGIGTTTPAYALDIYGNARLGTSTASSLFFRGLANFNNNFYVDISGNVATGTWQGTPIGVSYGGTGTSTNFTTGSIVFASANGIYSQNNAKLFWDNTNSRLGIGTTTPASTLGVYGTSTFMGGYVGIGTTTPNYTLDVDGTVALGSGAEAMRITTGGYVGIGTTTPATTLGVYGTSTFMGGYVGIGTTTPNHLLTVGKVGDATSTYRLGVYGSIRATGGIDPLQSFDIAERFPIDPQCQTDDSCPEPGDLVSVSENSVIKKSSLSYDSKLIGIVAESSAITMGGLDASTSRPVALAGRLLVKVSTENGLIAIGDVLTSSSSTMGVAMKAIQTGRVIGIALEPFTENSSPPTGKIMVFVNPHWYGGQLSADGSLASTPDVNSPTSGVEETFIQKIKQALASLGLTIENGVAQIRELVTDKLFAKKARIEKLEMVDKATGEIYCTWVENGEWQKVKGECDAVSNEQPSEQLPDEELPTEETPTEPPPVEAPAPVEPAPVEEPAAPPVESPIAEPAPSETAAVMP